MNKEIILLQHIDILLEQLRGETPTAAIIGQQMVGGAIPRMAVGYYMNKPLVGAFTKLGMSTKDIPGLPGLNPAQVAANTIGYSVLGNLATSAVKPFLDKYQEKKYGIIKPPDPRTLGQKITDSTLNTAKAITSSVGYTATRAAVGSLALGLSGGNPLAAQAATGLVGSLAMSPITSVVNKTINKPLDMIQQKIQQRRAQQ